MATVKKVSLIVVLAILFCFALTDDVPVMADYVAGVKDGDWAKYSYYLSLSYDVRSYWMKITIQKVNGTIISGVVEGNQAGSSSPPQPFSVNITERTGSSVIPDYIFIPANLTVGSVIPALNLTVQGITTRNDREAVYVIFSSSYGSTEYYWDRSTGVLLERALQPTTTIRLVNTNLWGSGLEFQDWLIMIVGTVVAIIIAVVVFVWVRKRRRVAAIEAWQAKMTRMKIGPRLLRKPST